MSCDVREHVNERGTSYGSNERLRLEKRSGPLCRNSAASRDLPPGPLCPYVVYTASRSRVVFRSLRGLLANLDSGTCTERKVRNTRRPNSLSRSTCEVYAHTVEV